MKQCTTDCPDGFTESGAACAQFEFCHSSCSACNIKLDPGKCTSCGSALTSLASYQAFATGVTESTCQLTATNNGQYLISVNKDTSIGGTSLLKSVTVGSTVDSTSGKLLSSFLYDQQVIEFMTLGSNTVAFGFDSLPIHKKMMVRIRAYTECTALNSHNQTIQVTLSGPTPTVLTQTLAT
jgi:hypothetical protein